MSKSDRDVLSVYKEAEDLIARAVDEGADAHFGDVRQLMEIGLRYRLSDVIYTAIAHLEREIASIRREKLRRSTRKPFIVKLKNLFKFF